MKGFDSSIRVRRSSCRHLHYEALEDRRMLSAADIVFLVDNSDSDGELTARWLKALVIGDTDNDDVKDTSDLSERLGAQGITDVRYGLVAFGEIKESDSSFRFAHSYLVDTDTSKPAFDRLFSSGDHILDAKTGISDLIAAQNGGREDGWDAIDHAIAEYDFRPGAVPVFVLVQNAQGRVFGVNDGVNSTLTRDGILAALRSKDVILNSLVVGDSAPMFDLSPYEASENDFNNIRILGVESSTSANGQHDYHAFNTATDTPVTQLPATQSDALQISGFRREGGR